MKKNIASIENVTTKATRLAPRNDRSRKKLKSTIGTRPSRARAPLDPHEGAERDSGEREQAQDRRRAPAPRVALDEREHDRGQPGRESCDARDVDHPLDGLVAGLARCEERHRARGGGHGKVEEED